ncbi:LytR/AlgR family response regulator transcription factor [Inhella crocodyli]|uniref:Response regulator transcription factor n=1 Tax=Inhella crocodyli TaxID=2499851 RepID=A0A437LHB4_9BURK|nr:LytTR family DNA-binding domain-containing protein [Inhella crocodyli]RVT84789.1 response regulator transcription factor [Inhella crocodyli]
MTACKILIADDEEGPREQMKAALARLWPQAQLVAAATNGVDAWDAVLEHEPDVAFLDIRMPGLTGLDVARRASQLATPPQVVFVTAFNDHALAAFDAGAIDYVLKPLDDARLQRAIDKLRARTTPAPAAPDLTQLLQSLLPPRATASRPIQASVGKEIKLIQPDEVVFFESDTRYTRVVTADQEALIRTPLKELIATLDAEVFWQVHRSVLVNSRHIASAVRVDENNMVLTLKGRSEKLPVSRQFQGLFKGQ